MLLSPILGFAKGPLQQLYFLSSPPGPVVSSTRGVFSMFLVLFCDSHGSLAFPSPLYVPFT